MEKQSKSINTWKILLSILFFLIVTCVVLYSAFPNYFNSHINRGLLGEILGKITRLDQKVLSGQEKPSVFEESLKPIYGSPEKISIESLGISAAVVPVGVDDKGYLETPKNWNEAGWYQKSAKPSEIGNLLINAHYDDNYGRPAAFWKLKNIKVDDKVTVLDSYGRYFHYKVVDIYYIGINDPKRSKVFEPFDKDKAVMTLITCGGVWVAGEGTYNNRLVVNAELIQ